ncbi:HAMP domain-containing histidine kinase [Rathayibacter sp. VKM Ac-2856]|uniref:sensor histidine kinase n=1 Tax=unclassified Rathayibacter TaxID=2609250 RepID=UPI001565A598|nr:MULTISPECIES: HAMP domain-containing sensor histidine kinase [unclassified Rathayibacter]NQX04263.1 HAMP domain-containing histidine kinase [Rathayibacter sp. VKM Ac-2858]NQX19432.1 HAMP domain-containing histidine kinase [Rathayibacter sp. VKM Ac-2856]
MIRRPPWSIRVRLTALVSAVILAVLLAGSVAFAALLRQSLVDAEAFTADQQARQIATDTESAGRLPPFDSDEVVIQLQREGEVVAVSDDDRIDTAPLPVADEPRIVSLDGTRFVVGSEDLQLGGDPGETVVVARTLAGADDAAGSALRLLAVAVPLVTLVVGVLVRFVVGRSLRPVERIRADVEAIEAADLERRVQEPPGSDELARLARTMNGLLDRLERSQAAQRRFVSNASHELRSPVAAIRQHAQVALRHPDAVPLADLAGVVEDEGERMQQLVTSLLLLARIDEGDPVPEEDVDLDDLVLAEAARLRALGVEVRTGSVGPAQVHGAEPLLRSAVRNAAENARRHAASVVAFTVRQEAGTAVVLVDDDGPGVPEEDRERVFHRFERRDDARARDTGGSGLGLAIVAEAARAGGGSARLIESPLGGARLEIRLPALD